MAREAGGAAGTPQHVPPRASDGSACDNAETVEFVQGVVDLAMFHVSHVHEADEFPEGKTAYATARQVVNVLDTVSRGRNGHLVVVALMRVVAEAARRTSAEEVRELQTIAVSTLLTFLCCDETRVEMPYSPPAGGASSPLPKLKKAVALRHYAAHLITDDKVFGYHSAEEVRRIVAFLVGLGDQCGDPANPLQDRHDTANLLSLPVALFIEALLQGLLRNGRVELLDELMLFCARMLVDRLVEGFGGTRVGSPNLLHHRRLSKHYEGDIYLLTKVIFGYQYSTRLFDLVKAGVVAILKHMPFEEDQSSIHPKRQPNVAADASSLRAKAVDVLQPHRCAKSRLAVSLIAMRAGSSFGALFPNFSEVFNRLTSLGYLPRAQEFLAFTGHAARYLSLTPSHLRAAVYIVTTKPIAKPMALPGISSSSSSALTLTPKKVAPCVTGLANLGNTCFMASVLQCLYADPQLRTLMLQSPFYGGKRDDDSHAEHEVSLAWRKCSSVSQMTRLFGEMSLTTKPAVHPELFRSSLPDFFRDYSQHDASEFLYLLLSKIEGEIQDQYPSKPSKNPKGSPGASPKGRGCPAWLRRFKKVIEGTTRREIRCGTCGNVSVSTDVFTGLDLKFHDENVPTKVDALLRAAMCSEETLTDDNMYECETCGKKVRAARLRVSTTSLPDCLVLVLGRFRYDSSAGGQRRKICTKADVPLSLSVPMKAPLNAAGDDSDSDDTDGADAESTASAPSMEGESDNDNNNAQEGGVMMNNYSLRAAACHTGASASSGHYYALARHEVDAQRDQWFVLNDAITQAVSSPLSILNKTHSPTDVPYILIYTRDKQRDAQQLPSAPSEKRRRPLLTSAPWFRKECGLKN